MPFIDDARAVGSRLRDARDRAGMSQRQLSFEGCSAAYISRIEAGERVPSLQLIHELASRLNVPAEYLARGVDEHEPVGGDIVEADVALRLGELDLAEEIYEKRLTDGPQGRLAALAGLGLVALRRGKLDQAIGHLEEVVAGRTSFLLADPSSVDALGRAYALRGDIESAIALFERARAEAETAGVPLELLRFCVLLANARADNGDVAAARSLLATAIGLAAESRDPLALARVYWTQSRVHVLNDQSRLARHFARKALEILERTENDAYIAMAYHLLAYTEIEGGAPERALPLLTEGRARFGSEFAPIDEAKFAIEEARALLALRKKAAAAKVIARAIHHLEALEPPDRGRAFAIVADTFAAAGDRLRAKEFYEKAVNMLSLDGRPYLVEVAGRYAEFLEDEGDTAHALQVLKSAIRPRTDSPTPLLESRSLERGAGR